MQPSLRNIVAWGYQVECDYSTHVGCRDGNERVYKLPSTMCLCMDGPARKVSDPGVWPRSTKLNPLIEVKVKFRGNEFWPEPSCMFVLACEREAAVNFNKCHDYSIEGCLSVCSSLPANWDLDFHRLCTTPWTPSRGPKSCQRCQAKF